MSYIKHRADESLEDYLETILLLQKNIGQVRSIDIANEMNFTKPSVSIAMKNLREKGYITNYASLSEEEKNRVMLELIKLKNEKRISQDRYYEETGELWKK